MSLLSFYGDTSGSADDSSVGDSVANSLVSQCSVFEPLAPSPTAGLTADLPQPSTTPSPTPTDSPSPRNSAVVSPAPPPQQPAQPSARPPNPNSSSSSARPRPSSSASTGSGGRQSTTPGGAAPLVAARLLGHVALGNPEAMRSAQARRLDCERAVGAASRRSAAAAAAAAPGLLAPEAGDTRPRSRSQPPAPPSTSPALSSSAALSASTTALRATTPVQARAGAGSPGIEARRHVGLHVREGCVLMTCTRSGAMLSRHPLTNIAACMTSESQPCCFAFLGRMSTADGIGSPSPLTWTVFECATDSETEVAVARLAEAFGASLVSMRAAAPAPSRSASVDTPTSPQPRLVVSEPETASVPLSPDQLARQRGVFKQLPNGLVRQLNPESPMPRRKNGTSIGTGAPAAVAPALGTAEQAWRQQPTCVIVARFVGSAAMPNCSSQAEMQRTTDDSIAKCISKLGRRARRNAAECTPACISVTTASLVVRRLDTDEVVLATRKNSIAFCGRGVETPDHFVIMRSDRDNPGAGLIATVLQDSEARRCVQALARAFGAELHCSAPDSPTSAFPTTHAANNMEVYLSKAPDSQLPVRYLGYSEVAGNGDMQTLFAHTVALARGETAVGLDDDFDTPSATGIPALLTVNENLVAFCDPNSKIVRRHIECSHTNAFVRLPAPDTAPDAPSTPPPPDGPVYCGIIETSGLGSETRYFLHTVAFSSMQQSKIFEADLVKFTRPRSKSAGADVPEVQMFFADLQMLSTHEQKQQRVQKELERLPERDIEQVMAEHAAAQPQLQDEKEELAFMVSLVAEKMRLYRTALLKVPGGRQRTRSIHTLKRTLAVSLENLLSKRDRPARPAKSGLSPSRGDSATESEATGADSDTMSSTAGDSPPRIQTRPGGADGPTMSPSPRSWRQALYQSVTTQQPYQASRMDRRGRSSISARGALTRSDYIRSLWQKAVQQQMLLLRMATENERLEAEKAREETLMKQKREDRLMKLKAMWTPVLSKPAIEWDILAVRNCIASGVPPALHGRLWLALARRFRRRVAASSYVDLLVQPCIYRHAIMIDIDRTFPDHPLFAEKGGPGQRSLFNLMKAYSVHDETVGYCQGLSFVGGQLLTQLNEEDAFRVLLAFMYELGFREQYMPDMKSLQLQLYQLSRLVHDFVSPVFEHLQSHSIDPFLYATPWFLSIFNSQFPHEFAARVLDGVLMDGITLLFRMVIVMLQHFQAQIVKCNGFEETLNFLTRELPKLVSPVTNELVSQAMAETDVSQQRLQQYAAEFFAMQDQALLSPTPAARTASHDPTASELQTALDSLVTSERNRERLQAELDLVQQQLNHAKSALQSLTIDNQTYADEIAELRAENSQLRATRAKEQEQAEARAYEAGFKAGLAHSKRSEVATDGRAAPSEDSVSEQWFDVDTDADVPERCEGFGDEPLEPTGSAPHKRSAAQAPSRASQDSLLSECTPNMGLLSMPPSLASLPTTPVSPFVRGPGATPPPYAEGVVPFCHTPKH